MAYDDTHCPCGGHKIRETMLCDFSEVTAISDAEGAAAFKTAKSY